MTDERETVDRRSFMGTAVGAAAGLGAATLIASKADAQQRPAGVPPDEELRPSMRTPRSLYRLEADVHDCQVTGTVPSDLNGAFYRVGPDPQYPLKAGNIPFDGEGHVSMFRIKNGRVDYKSRFVRNERYMAQDKARRILFPMYRNPYVNDPSVAGVSRSTANTHIMNHRNLLLALKEDSPPSALDLLTLETVVPTYTFDGQLPSKTFTAHPKIDSETGNMVAFGYESEGHGSDVVTFFEITPGGKIIWTANVRVPYVGMLHDFAVTQRHIVLYVIPLAIDEEQMRNGGIHWSWDSTKPTYFGAIRRGGDGSDLAWIEGPTRSATHIMGAFSDGDKVFVDVEMSMSNPFPFMPMRGGEGWDPIAGSSHITRLSADLSTRRPKSYGIETLYPKHVGALPRQDDRYNTMPYRFGFLPCPDPNATDRRQAGACYARFDHQTRRDTLFNAGPETSLAECCFAPKNANAREAEGYLMGVATRNNENGRADLVILDAEHLDDGPIATVHLPMRAVGQIHGWWVPEAKLPVNA
jgi:carotenoid cleavage dioxygenase-like enzyme